MNDEGETVSLSLPEIFEKAHLLKRLAGETPTQDFAVLRLLLAVLYASAFRGPYDSVDDALEEWLRVWEEGFFPTDIAEYLEQWKDRFWLFHEQRPFMQVPVGKDGINMENAADRAKLEKPGKCSVPGVQRASKLNGSIFESANKDKLFNEAVGESKYTLSLPESARWLIHVIGFDDGGIKHYYPKGSDMNMEAPEASCSVSWLGSISPVYAEGQTLFETLMLNTVMLRNGSASEDALWPEQIPSWEEDNLRLAEAVGHAVPNTPALLCSYPSRRIMLIRREEKVLGFIRYVGDAFAKAGAQTEQWTMWSMPKAKKNEVPVPVPRGSRLPAQMWREMSSLLIESDRSGPVPGVVAWIRLLTAFRHSPLSNRLVRFHYCKALYDVAQSSNMTELLDDSLSFSAGLLAESGQAWLELIRKELELCSSIAGYLRRLAEDLFLAEGGKSRDNKGKLIPTALAVTQSAEDQFYRKLDEPIRLWLSLLLETDDSEERKKKISELRETVSKIARQCGLKMVNGVSPTAYGVRRASEDNRKSCSAPEAWLRFQRSLRWVYAAEGEEVTV